MDFKNKISSLYPPIVSGELKDFIDVMLEYIEDNNINFDITELLYNPNSVVKAELYKTYLQNLYDILLRAVSDQNIAERLNKTYINNGSVSQITLLKHILNQSKTDTNKAPIMAENGDYLNTSIQVIKAFNGDYINNVQNALTDDYLLTSKIFKQKKGTRAGIRYAYNVIRESGLQDVDVYKGYNDPTFEIFEYSQVKIVNTSDYTID
jgi:hypothetical protein